MDFNNVFEKYSSEIFVVSAVIVLGAIGSYFIYQNEKNKKIKQLATVLSLQGPFFNLQTLVLKFIEGFFIGLTDKSN